MKMTTREKAIKRYNKIMFEVGCEHVTIGTVYSELYDENMPIEKMVEEVEYWLDTYYEDGHVNYEMKFEDYKRWLSETGKMKRFIKAYKGIEDELTEEQRKSFEELTKMKDGERADFIQCNLSNNEEKSVSVSEVEPEAVEETTEDAKIIECVMEEAELSHTETESLNLDIKNSQAYERAKKNENKLEKKEKLLTKLKAKYNDYVSTHDMSVKYNEIEDYNDKWERIEIDFLPDRIHRIEKEIKKLKELIDRQYNQAKQEKKRREAGELTPQERRMEAILNCPKELPQPLKDLSDQIEEREYQKLVEDIESNIKKNPNYCLFTNKETMLFRARSEAKMAANSMVRSVWVKIYEHTGNVKDYKNVHIVGYELNGLFYGEKGNASVHTFFAGGYNIQSLHLRTRVTPFN